MFPSLRRTSGGYLKILQDSELDTPTGGRHGGPDCNKKVSCGGRKNLLQDALPRRIFPLS